MPVKNKTAVTKQTQSPAPLAILAGQRVQEYEFDDYPILGLCKQMLGFTLSGQLAHSDGRSTRAVTLKRSVELLAKWELHGTWETEPDAGWDAGARVKWLSLIAAAIR